VAVTAAGVEHTVVLNVTERSLAGEARRRAGAMADRLGFGETERGKVALIVTEAANNLVQHATGGQVLLRPLREAGGVGLEILAVDRGPGIAELSRALQDGYSTAGTPGTGLGAIGRIASRFDIHSTPGKGTALVAHVWSVPPKSVGPFETGVVALPYPGEDVYGDGWGVVQEPKRGLFLVVDGLGHGIEAAAASRQAERVLEESAELEPEALLERIDRALRGTRGAAAGLAELRLQGGGASFVGIGNTASMVLRGDQSRRMVSRNGILGHGVRRFQAFHYDFAEDESILVMHSDGVSSQCELGGYPGLAARHPSVVAAVLCRDFARDRDDVTVLVARKRPRMT
jgi:anti-sigma regulatory factor (Ser/Thr protein kinase)